MTTSRTTVSRHKRRSPRDSVHELILQLQTLAFGALPREGPGFGTLRGKRIAEDKELLELYLENIRPALEEFERCFLASLSETTRRDHAYSLLLFLLRAAHFIGSRALMSFSQRNYFASKLGAQGGKKSAQARARESEEMWQAETLDLARRERNRDPHISTERLATLIREEWTLKIPTPSHRILVNFLALSAKNGRLVAKVKKSARK
jgi:hypothetical protein